MSIERMPCRQRMHKDHQLIIFLKVPENNKLWKGNNDE
jgi:hypothetical protein